MTDATPQRAPTSSPGQLHALTSLRFFAALLVVVQHFTIAGMVHAPASIDAKLQLRGAWTGLSGVAFFFVLSGFVLAWSYGNRLATPSARGIGRFWVARVARIWPAWLVVLSLGAVEHARLFRQLPLDAITGFVANALLVQNWIPASAGAHRPASMFNEVGWTLCCEAFFYALFPCMIWLAMRNWGGGGRPAWRPAAIAVVTCAALPLLVALGWYDNPDWEPVFTILPLTHLPTFALGVVLGRIALARANGPGEARPAAHPAVALALEVGSIGLVAFSIWLIPHVALTLRTGPMYIVPYACLIYVFARAGGPIARLLMHHPFVLLGEISYALYLLHTLVVSFGLDHLGLGESSPHWYWAAALAVSLGLSWLLWRVVEMPGRRLLSARGNRWLDRFLAATEQPTTQEPAGDVTAA